MTEFHVETVRVGRIEKHPNADSLGITRIHDGYPVIVRLGDYNEGDTAVYVPIDSVVPADDPRWEFLGGHTRIKAKKLRGVFSMGLLTHADPSWDVGSDVAEELRITRYEPPPKGFQGGPRTRNFDDDCDGPEGIPKYTDIEGLRRYGRLLVPGEEVVITEKIHGENMRAYYDSSSQTLHIGSRTRWKKPGVGGWWRAAERGRLAEKLGASMCCLYGESHGYTGGFPYGTDREPTFRAFDAFNPGLGRYLDFNEFTLHCRNLQIDMVPLLYRGPWKPEIAYELAEGQSTLDPSHVREGVVIRPVCERFDDHVGRVILKLHGEGFMLKGARQ